MRNIAGTSFEIREVIPSPKQWECRRKIQYSVRSSGNSDRLKIGYYQNKSPDIINIKHCPIQPEVCDRIVNYIRGNAQKFSVTGFNENTHSGDLRHVVMRSSSLDEKILLTLVINSKATSKNVAGFAKEIYNNFPEISGVCINLNDLESNLILSDKTECLCGEPFIREEICGIKFLVGTNTFFQVNPESAENIFKFVKDHIAGNFENPEILDAYAGISAFGFVLASVAKSVTSVEECRESVELAEEVRKINGISNVELNHMDAGEFFRQSLENGRKFDIIVLDPPRKGCSEESLTYATQLARKQIIYVSCNPATLARDLKFLTTLGGKVRFIQPFDMFCHTYHVESVAIIDMN